MCTCSAWTHGRGHNQLFTVMRSIASRDGDEDKKIMIVITILIITIIIIIKIINSFSEFSLLTFFCDL